MIVKYYPEEILIRQLQDGVIGYQQYVQRHSQGMAEDYAKFCQQKGYEQSDESALRFLEAMEAQFTKGIEDGEA